MLKKEYIRVGKNRVIGSITGGYEGVIDAIVRDEHGRVAGTTSQRFHNNRDEHGGLVSINTSDPGRAPDQQKEVVIASPLPNSIASRPHAILREVACKNG